MLFSSAEVWGCTMLQVNYLVPWPWNHGEIVDVSNWFCHQTAKYTFHLLHNLNLKLYRRKVYVS